MNTQPTQVQQPSDNSPLDAPAKSDIVMVARGGGTAFISTAATRALSYIYSLALIKVLGAEDFGQFSLAMASVLFFGTLASIGLPQGIVRFGIIRDPSNPRAGAHQTTLTAVRLAVPVSMLLTCVVVFLANWIAQDLFHKPDLYAMIRIFAISIPFMAMQAILLAATRALKVIRYSAIVWIIQPLLALVVGLILVMRGYGVNAAALAYVFSYVCGAALALFFYLRVIPRADRRGKAFPPKQMLKFSIPLSLTEWMHFANERTEIYFLGLLPSAVNISIYKIAWSLAGLETMLRLSLEQMLAPFSSDLSHRKETKQLERLYKAVTKWGFTIAVMLFAIYVLFGKEIMFIFDPALAAGAWVLIVLALAQLINEFTGPCNTLL
ncbi:MAG: oligosaccharide flippase family protein, partial [Anaerolineaceae bacterium]